MLPIGLVVGTFGFLGRIVGMFSKRERQISDTQLRFAFREALTVKERHKIISDSFAHGGKMFAESLLIQKILKDGRLGTRGITEFEKIQIDGVQYLREIAVSDRSAIVLSAHLGSIELLAAHHAAQGRSVTAVGRYPNYKILGEMLEDLRRGYGIEPMWRHDPSSMRKLLNILRGNTSLAVLIDQDTNLENGFAPFFGLPAASPITPLKIALRNKIPLYTGFAIREAHNQHRFIYDPVLPTATDENEAITEIINIFNRRMERLVRKYPGQWFWWHRRWRRRPSTDYEQNPNALRSTRDYISWLEAGAPEA